jgi:hypothetical protein
MNKRLVLGFCSLLAAGVARAELGALSDGEMGSVLGQEGIALSLNLYFNSTQSATPASDGLPLGALSSCAGIANPCHFGIKINNREDAGGEWLVFKDFYASLRVGSLNIDVEPLLSAAANNTAYFDATRFQGDAGACLLGTGNCTADYINTLPGLRLSTPATTTSYDPVGGLSSGYTSVELGLNIGRMATEFGATGYNSDVNGSFMGVRIDDNNVNSNFAGAAISGKVYVFGF